MSRSFVAVLMFLSLSILAVGCPGTTPSSPSNTRTPTATASITETETLVPTVTDTETETATETATDSPTATHTPTETSTRTLSNTPTETNTRTITNTPTITNTLTVTSTRTDTGTPTATSTAVHPFYQVVVSGNNYSAPSGIAVASSGNAVTIMVGNGVYNKVDLFIGTNTSAFSAPTTINLAKPGNPHGVAWNPVNSNFYLAVQDGGGPNAYIQRFTATGGNPGAGVSFGFPTGNPDEVAVDGAGNVYVSDEGTGSVYAYDMNNNPIGTPLTGYSAIRSMAYDPVNNQLAVIFLSGSLKLLRVNLDGSSPTTITGPTLPSQSTFVAFNSSSNLFLARPQFAGNQVHKYTNVAGSLGTLLATFGAYGVGSGLQLYNAGPLAFDSQGHAYVCDWFNSKILQFAPY